MFAGRGTRGWKPLSDVAHTAMWRREERCCASGPSSLCDKEVKAEDAG